MAKKPSNRYQVLLEKVFSDRFTKGDEEVPFSRQDLVDAAKELEIELPKNLGDVIYSVRYRTALPSSILQTQPDNKEWVINGRGRSAYVFLLKNINNIFPNPKLVTIKIPDATPEIVSAYSLSDEQALLAKIRYNRIIDLFLGFPCYSLQNHLRTTVSSIGQIEIDEIYVGVDRKGRQYVVPVQAKGGKDRIGGVQAEQDIICCGEKFPTLIRRAVSAQFMEDDLIAIFELSIEGDDLRIVDERHYELVPHSEISDRDLASYDSR